MTNHRNENIGLAWINDYHTPKSPRRTYTSVDEMKGNCLRCGKQLPNHEAQDSHNNTVHR